MDSGMVTKRMESALTRTVMASPMETVPADAAQMKMMGLTSVMMKDLRNQKAWVGTKPSKDHTVIAVCQVRLPEERVRVNLTQHLLLCPLLTFHLLQVVVDLQHL